MPTVHPLAVSTALPSKLLAENHVVKICRTSCNHFLGRTALKLQLQSAAYIFETFCAMNLFVINVGIYKQKHESRRSLA
jgi:hypothetical protein